MWMQSKKTFFCFANRLLKYKLICFGIPLDLQDIIYHINKGITSMGERLDERNKAHKGHQLEVKSQDCVDGQSAEEVQQKLEAHEDDNGYESLVFAEWRLSVRDILLALHHSIIIIIKAFVMAPSLPSNNKNHITLYYLQGMYFFFIERVLYYYKSGLLMSGKKVLKFEKEQVVQDKSKQEVFNFARLKESIDINVTQNTPQLLEMELKGIDAALANGLRRIIIAEIPTMAFHKVSLYQNTSVIPDELLVHRLGLLPIRADPNDFEARKEDQDLNSENSLKFELRVVCRRKKEFQNYKDQDLDDKKPEEYLDNSTVYSSQLRWVPLGNQATKLGKIKLVHENIAIAKLRQNQQIYIEIYAEKGIGKKHAKWSPVSTCFYRLMPSIQIASDFNHEKYSDSLINCCPSKVFGKKKGKAVVVNERDCTTCRACINLQGIELGKIKDHFIFTIESTGIFAAEDIFVRALKVLEDKAKSYVI